MDPLREGAFCKFAYCALVPCVSFSFSDSNSSCDADVCDLCISCAFSYRVRSARSFAIDSGLRAMAARPSICANPLQPHWRWRAHLARYRSNESANRFRSRKSARRTSFRERLFFLSSGRRAVLSVVLLLFKCLSRLFRSQARAYLLSLPQKPKMQLDVNFPRADAKGDSFAQISSNLLFKYAYFLIKD